MYPILFAIGPIEIHTSSLLLSIGAVIAILLFLKGIQFRRLNLEFLMHYYLHLLIAGIMGARLFFFISNYEFVRSLHSSNAFFAFFALWDKKFSFLGAIFGILLTLTILTKRKQEETGKWLDAFTTPVLTVLAFYHAGNFFEGTNYGKETLLPWGMIFEGTNVKYTVHIHPTQVYALIYTLGILTFLKFYKKLSLSLKEPGEYFLHATALYTLLTFLEGFLRGDDTLILSNFRIEQILAFIICLMAIVAMKIKILTKNTHGNS